MNRRTFIAAASVMVVVPAAARAVGLDYTPGLVQERLAAGETVFIDFAADWCTTCRAQERVIADLINANPAYAKKITFVRVDWDQHSRGELATGLNIPRRSTLVVLKGDEELGRIVAGTRRNQIQELMDIALNA